MGNSCCAGDDAADRIPGDVQGPADQQDAAPKGSALSLPVAAIGAARARAPAQGAEMVIEFRCLDGTTVSKAFRSRPLGVDFDNTQPIVVKRVKERSLAEASGVQAGWQIAGVNGQDVLPMDFAATHTLLKVATSLLPEANDRPGM
mmetsp:Transcript_116682/g.326400  ORF Transcript_116682/g.326400 Transcript_116682/m.326400 type:complete len:146 (+) Transcript_116682:38-475(+)